MSKWDNKYEILVYQRDKHKEERDDARDSVERWQMQCAMARKLAEDAIDWINAAWSVELEECRRRVGDPPTKVPWREVEK